MIANVTVHIKPSANDLTFGLNAGFHLNECNEAANVGACVVGSNVDSPSAALGRIG